MVVAGPVFLSFLEKDSNGTSTTSKNKERSVALWGRVVLQPRASVLTVRDVTKSPLAFKQRFRWSTARPEQPTFLANFSVLSAEDTTS